ncbi:hypothetical protein [Neptunomonas qingdaonensis]|uniref:Lipoprotein n=1 Tax=Neptunomonas qingdaonensis TaxID=1045558 RepID=A0A1I2QJQ3_9GAMM|nr:hypothetical protein [Neptunomonas qingdaonensis]SFG28624.1 hypothetical protein SAMN05216175_1056 [Neptunomonas qingdaonensis]
MKRILTLLVAITMMVGCTTNVTKEQLQNANYGTLPTSYDTTVDNYLNDSLKDPDSKRVKYIDTPKKGHWYYSGDQFGYFVCAAVNAKNSYGGYTGKSLYFFGFHNEELQAVFNDKELGGSYVSCMCDQKPINSLTLSCK